jgi:trk system potassium uptake protein TrkH
LLLIGGCSGSTSGGIKVVRWSVMMKQAVNEFRRLLHPHGVYTVWLNGQPGREVLVPGVAAFVCAYFLLVLLTALLGACAGLTPFEALSGGLSMMGNVGPAFGQIGPAGNYGALPDWLKGWYSFIMLTGRLEIYTMLILVGNLFFWRRRTAA